MNYFILRFDRELMTGGAPEKTSVPIHQLELLLQAKQINSVPYRSK